jgi:TP901 family phage tail tape measure protein
MQADVSRQATAEAKRRAELEEYIIGKNKQRQEAEAARRAENERKFANQELDRVNAGKKVMDDLRKSQQADKDKQLKQTKEVNDILDRVNKRDTANREKADTARQKALDRAYKDQERNDLKAYRDHEARQKSLDRTLKAQRKQEFDEHLKMNDKRWKETQRMNRQAEQEKTRLAKEGEAERNRNYVSRQQEAQQAAMERRQDAIRTFTGAAAVMGSLGGGILGGFGASVDEYSKFNLALTESTSIMEVNKAQTKQMKDQVFELASKGPQAPKDLAQAYYFLASAGMKADAAISALPAVQAFATAGAFSMQKATSLASNALSAMGMKSENAVTNLKNLTRVTDVLVRANILADGTTEQFGQSLTKQAGAALRSYGKSIEEGVAVLAVMADQGDRGVTAGTHLSMVLRHLSESFHRHKQVYDQLGISVFDTTGKMKHMADIVKSLEKVLLPMSDEQRTKTLMSMGFQAKLQQSILPLLGMGDKIQEFYDDLQKAGGSSADVQKKQMEAFANQLKVVSNAITMTAIDIGEQLAPAFLAVGETVKEAISWIRDLDPAILKAGATVGAVLGVFLTFSAGVMGVAAAFVFLGPQIVAGIALLTAMSVVGGVVVGGLVQGAGGIEAVWKMATSALKDFWEFLKPVRDAITSLGKTVVQELPKAFQVVKDLAAEAWKAVGGQTIDWANVRDNLQLFFLFIEYSLKNVQDVSELAWVFVKLKAIEAFNLIANNFGLIVFTGMTGGMNLLVKNWQEMNDANKQSSKETFAGILSGYSKFMKLFGAIGQGRVFDAGNIMDEMQKSIFGQDNKVKFTPSGFEFTNMTKLEEDLRKQFEDLNGKVGLDSEKWKNFVKKKREEFALPNLFKDSDLKKTEMGAIKAQKTVEQFKPGDFMEKQFHKFDSALFGSAEAITRIEQQFNMLRKSWRETENVIGGDAAERTFEIGWRTRSTNRNALEQYSSDILKRIADGIDQVVGNTENTTQVTAANFTG